MTCAADSGNEKLSEPLISTPPTVAAVISIGCSFVPALVILSGALLSYSPSATTILSPGAALARAAWSCSIEATSMSRATSGGASERHNQIEHRQTRRLEKW